MIKNLINKILILGEKNLRKLNFIGFLNFSKFIGKKTFIIITHRKSVLKHCNKGFFLENGMIKENLQC